MLPFSSFWASDRPFRTPAAALLLHWIFSVIIIIGPPAGDTYSFIVNLESYQGACFSVLVCCGLLYLQYRKSENWTSPFHSPLPLTLIAIFASLILVIVPFIPPKGGNGAFKNIPYYVFPVVGWAILFVGVIFWYVYAKVLPNIGGYKISVEREILEDGNEVVRHKRIKHIQQLPDIQPRGSDISLND